MMLLQIIGKPWFNFIVLCIEKLLVLVEHSHRKCINLILVHMHVITVDTHAQSSSDSERA